MIIEFEINGARVIVTGENLAVNISEEAKAVPVSKTCPAPAKRRNIEQIIKAAGGASVISRKAGPADDWGKRPLTYDAVYKWSKNGIPDRHWSLLMSLTDTTAEELFHANSAVRESAA